MLVHIEALRLNLRQEATFETLTSDVLKSSEIERKSWIWGWNAPQPQKRRGCWRDDSAGPMQVVSGPTGKPRVHVLNRLLDGFEENLTTSKYAGLAKCSQDAALRDILPLVERGVLASNPEAGRSTSYMLAK